ncbi:MAG: chorismate mutase, partial [Alphaproteobacteria bacterium]|nr:chorismate mutase [Alphaproteobacteria bacterium]
MTSQNSQLNELRRQINAIDKQILNSLQLRAVAVRQVAAAKAGSAPWRPAREAILTKKLARNATPALNARRIEKIWRAILNDSVNEQKPLAIFTAKHTRIITHQHFGFDATTHTLNSADEAVNELDNSRAWQLGQIAVIPTRQWHALINTRKHIAVLAILAHENQKALAVSGSDGAEPSNNDITLVAVRANTHAVAVRDYKQHAQTNWPAPDPKNGGAAKLNGQTWQLLVLRGWLASENFTNTPRRKWLGVAPTPTRHDD